MFPLEPFEKGLTLQPSIQTQLLLNLRPHLPEGVLSGSPVMLDVDFAWQLTQVSIPPCGLLRHPRLQCRDTYRLSKRQRLQQLPYLTICNHRKPPWL